MEQEHSLRCPACHSKFPSSIAMIARENSELRMQNQLLVREMAMLRRELDARDLIYDSTNSIHPDNRQFEEFCVELVSKFDRAAAEMQKKKQHFEQEIHRYRGLVTRLLQQLSRQATKENQPVRANRQHTGQSKVLMSMDGSTQANLTAYESIVVHHTPPKQSYLSSCHSDSLH